MEQKTLLQAAQKMLERGQRKKWEKVVSLMAAVVVFCTTYALILPAITVSTDPICGLEEHIHTETCYTEQEAQPVLLCTAEDLELHEHTEECYDDAEELICGIADFVVHTHVDGCYDSEGMLVCDLEEIEEHAHGVECWIREKTLRCELEEDPGHTHDDTCYKQIKGDLTCTQEEHEGHSHGEACYETVTDADGSCGSTEEGHVCSEACLTTRKLVCAQKETAGHTHNNLCYTWNRELTCVTEERPAGHIHGDSCYLIREILDCDKPEVELHAHDIECYGDILSEEGEPLIFEELLAEAEEAWEGEGEYVFDPEEWADFMVCEKLPVFEHIHADTCFEMPAEGETVQVLTCGMTEHTHDDIECYPAQDIYYCGLPEHTHSELDCYSTQGQLLCELEEHSHTEECRTVPVSEEVRYVIDLIDTLPDLDTVELILATYEEQEDMEGYAAYIDSFAAAAWEAYDLYTAMDDETKLLVSNADRLLAIEPYWSMRTLEEPAIESITHEEGSVSGTYYHAPKYKYYELSNHRLAESEIMTFPLIPDYAYSSDWTPNTTEWSAKADTNYLAAYCAECLVLVSSNGTDYDSFAMNNSRFASPELRQQLAGVIAHSYPFLTREEMRAELIEAWENGEIAVDVSECSESEYMAATQAAIWKLMLPGMKFDTFTSVDTTTEERQALVDLTIHEDTETGHTSETGADAHCDAIQQWLMQQAVPADLAVADYDYTVEQDEFGLYDLTVTGEFNRRIIAGEVVAFQLSAGTQKTQETILSAGTSDFRAELSDLTEKELLDALVSLEISGKRMQAYYFENPQYQDLISGQWEYYDQDLSFTVTRDTTSVSVIKHWTEEAPTDGTEVEVLLFADGVQTGEPVTLNAENNWTYIWSDMPKYNALDQAIVYTVQEMPLAGYYSSVTAVEGESSMVKVWQETDHLEDGGQYMLVSNVGGFAADKSLSGSQEFIPTWTTAHPEDVSACDPGLIWTAKAAENGEFYLYNTSVDARLGYCWNTKTQLLLGNKYLRVLPTSESAKWLTFCFEEGVLSTDCEGNTDLEFCYIGTNGGKITANFRNRANYLEDLCYTTEFTLYELIEQETPLAEIQYRITNTKIGEETERIAVSVVKKWAGRPDGIYPEEALVQLQQNGSAYDVPMQLHADNNWSWTWEDLPAADANGEPFVYTVREVDVPADYTDEISRNGELENAFVITNIWTPEIEIELHKADTDQSDLLLPDAEFDLYLAADGGAECVPVPGTENILGIKLGSVSVGSEGIARMAVTSDEIYYLVETKAPAGYNLLAEPIAFAVDKIGSRVELTLISGQSMAETSDGILAVLTVYNDCGMVLPETGGGGTQLYQLGGTVLSLISAAGLLNKKRKSRGGKESS